MTVDSYINSFPPDIQGRLKLIRATIKENAPEAQEGFSYGMPAYKTNGKPLVYFAGFSKHIGFYALPSGHTRFAIELSKYKQGKGSVQFPLNEELPIELIARIVKFRVGENSSIPAKTKKDDTGNKTLPDKTGKTGRNRIE